VALISSFEGESKTLKTGVGSSEVKTNSGTFISSPLKNLILTALQLNWDFQE
jgi:hypothetical protein